MKILMVSRWFWEERRRNGGRPGFFGELAQAVTARGVDLTILSQAADAGAVPESRPVDGIDVHVFSREGRTHAFSDKAIKFWAGYRKAATDAAVIRNFARGQGRFDAVVAQCEEPDGLACAWALRSGGGPPLVTQVHDLRYRFGVGGVRFVRKSSLGFVFRKSARVVANSEQTAVWLREEYGVPEDKIGQCRIHLTAPFLERAGTDFTPSEEKRILFLGALNRKKAPDVFLRAARLLAPELDGWTFVLVGPETDGDPSFQAELRSLASPLGPGVEWAGGLGAAGVIEQIRRARVVVCPSRLETFSRTTVEALALGRPVVVTATTGAARWVESTGAGSVVPPGDAEALAGGIRRWLSETPAPGATAGIAGELTAARAAEDWVREVRAAITSLR